jgi:hypothetical protein
MAMYLVHFKSRDLTRLHRQGQFWHILFSSGSVVISQDEVDTWTTHGPISLDVDPASLNPEKAVYEVLGGSAGPFPIKIDEILVTSAWRPNICIVDRYMSPGGRIFLSGDAAHQNIPFGGYGMNTALGDSFDIGWKLAAVLDGYGGQHLLRSYEAERRPVALRNIDHSGVHAAVHFEWWGWCQQAGNKVVISQTEEGRKLRTQIAHHLQEYDGENKDQGIEMDYRYHNSPVIIPDGDSTEPIWNRAQYTPSTWPGARAPHVFLADGETSIFDLFGPNYTFIDFSEEGKLANTFQSVAKSLSIPLKVLLFPNEAHAQNIWGRAAFLIRPDDHVAWRAPPDAQANVDVEEVLLTGVGQTCSKPQIGCQTGYEAKSAVIEGNFTSTIGNVDQEKVEMLAEFQE